MANIFFRYIIIIPSDYIKKCETITDEYCMQLIDQLDEMNREERLEINNLCPEQYVNSQKCLGNGFLITSTLSSGDDSFRLPSTKKSNKIF